MRPSPEEKVIFARSRGGNRSYVKLVAAEVGNDLLVRIFGGTHPHIGAVAIGIPYSSQRTENGTSASVSVHTLVGHKDDSIAQWAADRIARTLNRIVVAVVGIHIDNAAMEEIEVLVETGKELVQEFLRERLSSASTSHFQ